MFSLGCPISAKHMKHSYTEAVFRRMFLLVQIFAVLGWMGYRVSMAISLNAPKFWWKKSILASHMWPPTQTITKFCTMNCSSSSSAEFGWTGSVGIDVLLHLRTESAASAWMVRAVSCVTFGAGRSALTEHSSDGLEVLLSQSCQGFSLGAPLAASCSGHVSQDRGQGRGCAAGWVSTGVFAVLPQCWSCCYLS